MIPTLMLIAAHIVTGLRGPKATKVARLARELRVALAGTVHAREFDAALTELERLGTKQRHPDNRTHLARGLVGMTFADGSPGLNPMELLAVAVASTVEKPVESEEAQAHLYDAWKKRHGQARRWVARMKAKPTTPGA